MKNARKKMSEKETQETSYAIPFAEHEKMIFNTEKFIKNRVPCIECGKPLR